MRGSQTLHMDAKTEGGIRQFATFFPQYENSAYARIFIHP